MHGDERGFPPRAAAVDRLRQDLLAHARLALDHQAGAALRGDEREPADAGERGAPADQIIQPEQGVRRSPVGPGLRRLVLVEADHRCQSRWIVRERPEADLELPATHAHRLELQRVARGAQPGQLGPRGLERRSLGGFLIQSEDPRGGPVERLDPAVHRDQDAFAERVQHGLPDPLHPLAPLEQRHRRRGGSHVAGELRQGVAVGVVEGWTFPRRHERAPDAGSLEGNGHGHRPGEEQVRGAVSARRQIAQRGRHRLRAPLHLSAEGQPRPQLRGLEVDGGRGRGGQGEHRQRRALGQLIQVRLLLHRLNGGEQGGRPIAR